MNLQDIKIMLVKGQKGDKGDGSYDDTELRQMIADEALAREAEIAQLERDWLNYMYPVGSIYISVNSTSPQTLFGGIWEQIQGKFLLASSSSHTAGSTGGVESNTLTINNLPSHSHTYPRLRLVSPPDTSSLRNEDFWAYETSTAGGSNAHQFGLVDTGNTDNTSSVGSGTAIDNMPPYLSVYVWKRTD